MTGSYPWYLAQYSNMVGDIERRLMRDATYAYRHTSGPLRAHFKGCKHEATQFSFRANLRFPC